MIEDYRTHLVEEARARRMSRREALRRASVAGLSGPALAVLLAACGKGGDTSTEELQQSERVVSARVARTGGTLRAGVVVPAAEVDPLTVNDGGAAFTIQTSCEYLSFPAADLRLEPRLAAAWRPGSTVQEWTFTLRDDVVWHDGAPFSADDVVASYDRYTDPDGRASARSSFAGILSRGNVVAIDSRTVRFHLDRPYADFPYLVSALNFAAPILPRRYEAGDFARGGVGTGAYVLRKYTPQQGASYVRNDRYWGGVPHLDGIETRYFADSAAIVGALRDGAIDFLPGIGHDAASPLRGRDDIVFSANPSSSYRPVHLRVDRQPFDDRRVRHALAFAVDRDALIALLLGGEADRGEDHAFAPVFPVSPQAGELVPRAYDPDASRALLAEAGHPDGLDLTLTTLDYEDIPKLAEILKAQLAVAGVRLDVRILSPSAYFRTGNTEPWLRVPMGIVYWASRGTPSQLIAPAYLSDSVWNAAHWQDLRFDGLMRDLDAQPDESKRKAIALEAARHMRDETPALIPFWLRELRAVHRGVTGIAPGPSVVWDPSSAGFTA